MGEGTLEFCSIWQMPCIGSDCVSYETHTKQRFKNMKTGQYIPFDQLIFYKSFTQEQLDQIVERNVTIVKECKHFAKIIQIENKIDHLIPLI